MAGTLFENNLSPYLTVVEGTTPASPASGQDRLFVRSSDHVLCMVNSGGTVTALSGSLTNPMTNVGDIIYGGTAGAPTRLADVATGSVLISGGVNTAPSWGSYFATTAHAECSADVTLSSINTLTDSTGCSISLVTGTWDIIAIITFLNGGTAGYIYAEIRDGSNADVSSARANLIAGGYGTLPLMARVTPGSTTTYKLSGQSGVATDKILRYANGTVIGTMLTATRVA